MQKVTLPSLEDVGNIARAAGKLTTTYFRREIQVDEKEGDLGLVTEADIASENFIKSEILKNFQGHVILGEESGWSQSLQIGAASGHPLTSDLPSHADGTVLWIIDPIDGTTNFSKGNIYHCISIACGVVINGQFSCKSAAIYQPGTEDLFTAAEEQGAWMNGRPMRVGAGSERRRWSITTGFSSNKGESLHGVIRCIEIMQNRVLGVRINGAAALDLALTASGIFNGFFESRLSPWDMAAGELLVKEAGGLVVNYEGQRFDVLKDKNIVAGPEHVVEDMLEMISSVKAELRSSVWP